MLASMLSGKEGRMALMDELTAERRSLREQLAGVEALQRRLRLVEELIAEYGGEERKAKAPAKPADEERPPARTGLRDAIRQAVEERFAKGTRPAEVTALLEEQGFGEENGTKTDLATRVRNEMWRMARDGQFRKQGGQYLPLLPEQSKEAQGVEGGADAGS
jgi:hypothetical protein